jgi:hypothetical protein
MTNTLFYLLASAYSGASGPYGSAAATCTVNGRLVACPARFTSPLLAFPFWIIILAIVVLSVVSMWIIFQKAGKRGWAAIIPIYSTIVLLSVVKKPTWWIILFFIPYINMLISIIVIYHLAAAFGKGIGFTVGLVFLPFIFYPILAFGKSTYTPPVAKPENALS